MDYLDFDIELREHDDGHYQIMVRGPVGEASASVIFPFTDAELESHLLRLENAILRSTGRRRQPQTEEERIIQSFGRKLFDFLLKDDARALYYESLGIATQQQQGIRIRLHVGAPALAHLPWEFLYDPRRGDYVCLNTYTPLVRYLDLPQRVQPLPVTPPLRILSMIASPNDLHALDTAMEKANLERALHDLVERGLVELTWLPGETWRDLQHFMRTTAGPWHIFHFIGHGGFDAERGEGVLYLANEQSRSRAIGAIQLSRLLAGQRYALRLVVLNACEGARGGREDILSSTAATLMQGEIPAVLAMQYDITDKAAVEFARAFYEAMADGLPLDTAVTDARNAISLTNEQSLEWGTPVLYMRTQDGRVFDIQSPPVAEYVPTPSVPVEQKRREKTPLPKPPAAPPRIDARWRWGISFVIVLLMTVAVFNWENIGSMFGFGSASTPPPTETATVSRATQTPSDAEARVPSPTTAPTPTATRAPIVKIMDIDRQTAQRGTEIVAEIQGSGLSAVSDLVFHDSRIEVEILENGGPISSWLQDFERSVLNEDGSLLGLINPEDLQICQAIDYKWHCWVKDEHIDYRSVPTRLEFSSDKQHVAYVNEEHLLKVHKVADGELVWQIPNVWMSHFSPDGRLIVVDKIGMQSNTIYSTANGEQIWESPSAAIPDTVIGKSNGRLIAYIGNGELMLLSTITNPFKELWRVEECGSSLRFSPDEKFLVYSACGHAGPPEIPIRPKLRDVATGNLLWELNGISDEIIFSPNGQLAATNRTADGEQQLSIRRAATGEELWKLLGFRPARFSPDGRLLAVNRLAEEGAFGAFAIVDMERHKVVWEAEWSHNDPIFSPNAQLVASGGFRNFGVWDAAVGAVVWQWQHDQTDMVDQMEFSVDGRQLTTIRDNGTIEIWTTMSWTDTSLPIRIRIPENIEPGPKGFTLETATDTIHSEMLDVNLQVD